MRTRVRRLGIAALAVAAALAATARAQDVIPAGAERANSLSGHVEVEGVGSPPERLEVTIRRAIGAGETRLFTDSTGNFFARGLFPGNYVVTVKPPLRTDLTEGSAEVMIPDGENMTYTVTVFLKKTSPNREAITGGRLISAQESDRSVPKEARKAYRDATAALKKQRVDEAIAGYVKALDVAPTYLFALNDLGVQYLRRGRYAEATDVLRRATAAAPTSFPPHLNLAISLYGAGNVDDAAAEIRAALAIDPLAADGLYLSGIVAKKRGDTDAAISAFQKSYEQGGADAIFAEFELGLLYDAAGQAPAAVRAYRLFLQFVRQGPQADHAKQRVSALARA